MLKPLLLDRCDGFWSMDSPFFRYASWIVNGYSKNIPMYCWKNAFDGRSCQEFLFVTSWEISPKMEIWVGTSSNLSGFPSCRKMIFEVWVKHFKLATKMFAISNWHPNSLVTIQLSVYCSFNMSFFGVLLFREGISHRNQFFTCSPNMNLGM